MKNKLGAMRKFIEIIIWIVVFVLLSGGVAFAFNRIIN